MLEAFAWIATAEGWLSLLTLTFLEIVLGIDNILFISVLTERLDPEHRPKARQIGLIGALVMRLILLSVITWIIGLSEPFVTLFTGMPWIAGEDGFSVAWRDVILLGGGAFLIGKATTEIHHAVEGDHEAKDTKPAHAALTGVIIQIMLLDMVFSLDSVITAVGMAEHLSIMMLAVVLSIGVMLMAAKPIGDFVRRHPMAKMLALSFLVLIGVALVADGLHFHIPKGYLYFAILFAIGVEALNMAVRRNRKKGTPRSIGTPNPDAAAEG